MGNNAVKAPEVTTQIVEQSSGTHLMELHMPTLGFSAFSFVAMIGLVLCLLACLRHYCGYSGPASCRRRGEVELGDFPMLRYGQPHTPRPSWAGAALELPSIGPFAGDRYHRPRMVRVACSPSRLVELPAEEESSATSNSEVPRNLSVP